MLRVSKQGPTNWDHVMLWAAVYSVAFFGFLWSEEFTAPEKAEFDSREHLSSRNIAINNVADPKVILVCFTQFKMYQFRQGVTIFLGWTDSVVCPVTALLVYW